MLTDIDERLNENREKGHHKKKKGSKKRIAHQELLRLRKFVSEMETMLKGLHTEGIQEMSIRLPDGNPFKVKGGFEESLYDSVYKVDGPRLNQRGEKVNHAQDLLDLMESGAPMVQALIPIGHGGDLSKTDEEHRAYRESIIGERTIGMAPDDRIDHMWDLIKQAQIAMKANRMTYTPEQVLEAFRDIGDPDTAKVTAATLQNLCDSLGLHTATHLPHEHELTGLTREQVAEVYRDKYRRLREMADIAYSQTPYYKNPAAPDSIWDFAKPVPVKTTPDDTGDGAPAPWMHTAEQIAPQEPDASRMLSGQTQGGAYSEDIQTSFDEPIDTAFSILKNID
jgi:hypothetical protein